MRPQHQTLINKPRTDGEASNNITTFGDDQVYANRGNEGDAAIHDKKSDSSGGLLFNRALPVACKTIIQSKAVIDTDLGNLAAQSVSLLHVDNHGYCKEATETFNAAVKLMHHRRRIVTAWCIIASNLPAIYMHKTKSCCLSSFVRMIVCQKTVKRSSRTTAACLEAHPETGRTSSMLK